MMPPILIAAARLEDPGRVLERVGDPRSVGGKKTPLANSNQTETDGGSGTERELCWEQAEPLLRGSLACN